MTYEIVVTYILLFLHTVTLTDKLVCLNIDICTQDKLLYFYKSSIYQRFENKSIQIVFMTEKVITNYLCELSHKCVLYMV